tara:strand:- start:731 stop:1099 length:369 start_codon:yes stop_codon:yes gene_type:complete
MKYFTEDELKCSHCGESRMNESFMNKIEALREQLGFPFPVNSAYRCPEHPIEARKSSPGAHSTGHAIDIGVRGEKAYMLLDAAVQAGLTGIGINQKGSSGRFIHLDDIEGSRTQPRPTIWSY